MAAGHRRPMILYWRDSLFYFTTFTKKIVEFQRFLIHFCDSAWINVKMGFRREEPNASFVQGNHNIYICFKKRIIRIRQLEDDISTF